MYNEHLAFFPTRLIPFKSLEGPANLSMREIARRMAWLPVVAVTLLFLTPASEGTSYTSPFPGLSVYIYNQSFTPHCTTGAFTTRPSFNNSTGVGIYASKGGASACHTNNTGYVENKESDFELGFNFTVAKSRDYSLQVIVKLVAKLAANLTAGNCTLRNSFNAGCLQAAEAFVGGSAYIFDDTNGSEIYSSSSWGYEVLVWNRSGCQMGVCSNTSSNSSSASLTVASDNALSWSNVWLNSHHKYTIRIFLVGGVGISFGSHHAKSGDGFAAASFNAGSAGRYIALKSIRIH
jgi:hypothetical protein